MIRGVGVRLEGEKEGRRDSGAGVLASHSKNVILISCWLPCALQAKKIENFCGVRTAKWPPLLLFSGAYFCRKPSNTSL